MSMAPGSVNNSLIHSGNRTSNNNKYAQSYSPLSWVPFKKTGQMYVRSFYIFLNAYFCKLYLT
jgi:hypothetical protein